MTAAATVVVLHAHPDDEAIFTGATMHRLGQAGARVVLITATSGEAGQPRVRLASGETMRHRRVTELERACELLGVARLVLLGHRDSGAHTGPFAPGTLGAASPDAVARRVAEVVEEEQATALVHYDRGGIYAHVDHLQVHRAGDRVVRRLGVTGYEATVDGAHLRRGPRHVLQDAAGDDAAVGVAAHEVSFAVDASAAGLLAKMAAMAAHASQIGPAHLRAATFGATYGREWFVRRGPVGVVDDLLQVTTAAATGAASAGAQVGELVGASAE